MEPGRPSAASRRAPSANFTAIRRCSLPFAVAYCCMMIRRNVGVCGEIAEAGVGRIVGEPRAPGSAGRRTDPVFWRRRPATPRSPHHERRSE